MIVVRQSGPDAVIRAVSEYEPERALLAAIIQRAVEDAPKDADAVVWLASTACLRMLAWLIPDQANVTVEDLHTRLLDRLPARVRARVTETANGMCRMESEEDR